jgi:predicted PurR-regulated permease PerM
MEKFIAENPGVIYILIGGLLALLAWLIKMAISNLLKKVEEVDNKSTEIEKNYKEEFKTIRKENNERHIEVLDNLSTIRVEIAKIKKG